VGRLGNPHSAVYACQIFFKLVPIKMNIKLLISYVTRVSCQLVYDSELVFNSCFLIRVLTRVSNQFGNWYQFFRIL